MRGDLCGLMVVAIMAAGCVEDGAVASDPDGSGEGWMQSETSMARTLVGPNRQPRLVLGYNDGADILDSAGVRVPNYSLLGLSISDDLGQTWTRVGQFDPAFMNAPALAGDPWVAAAGPLVLYVGIARRRLLRPARCPGPTDSSSPPRQTARRRGSARRCCKGSSPTVPRSRSRATEAARSWSGTGFRIDSLVRSAGTGGRGSSFSTIQRRRPMSA